MIGKCISNRGLVEKALSLLCVVMEDPGLAARAYGGQCSESLWPTVTGCLELSIKLPGGPGDRCIRAMWKCDRPVRSVRGCRGPRHSFDGLPGRSVSPLALHTWRHGVVTVRSHLLRIYSCTSFTKNDKIIKLFYLVRVKSTMLYQNVE